MPRPPTFQEASDSAIRSTEASYPVQGLPEDPERSGYNRSILCPPAQGVGSEHMKLRATYNMTNEIPITDAQQLRILERAKRDEPLAYQHALDGQQVCSLMSE